MATWKTVTVASSGGDYTTLSAALSGEATDVTAQSGDLIISCENFSDVQQVSTTGQAWTTDATHRVLIQIVDAHNGEWTTSAYRLETTGTCFRNTTIDDLEIVGIQVREHGTSLNSRCIHYQTGLDSGTQVLQKFILIQDHNDVTDPVACIEIDDPTPVYKLSNGIMYGDIAGSSTLKGLKVDASTAVVYCDNVTIDSVDNGLDITSPNIRFRNSRITNVNNVKVGTGTLHSASNYNLTDGTAPTNWGANSLDSTDSPVIAYVDDSNATMKSRDYKLSGASDSGYEAGTDLSGDSNNPFSDDITGTARTVPWDIGAHEKSFAGVAVLSLAHWRLRSDDGVEATGGATFLKGEDVGISITDGGDVALDTNFRVRLVIDENNTGDPAASVIQVRAKKNADAAFDVTGSSTDVKMTASSQFADGAATTNHGFTVPSGAFLAGEILETDGSTTSLNLAQNAFTVIEFCVQALAADLSNLDVLEFGLRYDGVDYFAGSTMATITIGSGPSAATSFVAGSPDATTVGVTWTDTNSAVANPVLWLSSDAGTTWIEVAILAKASTAYTFTGLAVSTTYSLGITYWIAPNQSTMATDTVSILGASQTLSPTAPALTLSALAGTLSTGAPPVRNAPASSGGGRRRRWLSATKRRRIVK